MKFSNRRILRKRLSIFNQTGTIMQLIMRVDSGLPSPYDPTVSGNLFTQHIDPIENSSNYTFRYIKGRFDESDSTEPSEVGRQRMVKGIITIPMLFKDLLKQAEYIDPYLNGSRFIKTSGLTNEGRSFITCEIQSYYNKDTAAIVQGG